MGLLRRIFGGGEAAAEADEAPAAAPEPEGDPAARIDAARERLREEIPPLEDGE